MSSNSRILVAVSSYIYAYAHALDGYYRYYRSWVVGTGMGQLRSGITTDLNGFTIVAGNNHVTIFDQDGNYIHCCGSKGSANGQFSSLCGVAVSPNGTIYVSDRGNSRIQIF